MRYQGGSNAGHTVVVGDKTFKFRLLPSGILQGKRCMISAGVSLDPMQLLKELENVGAFAKSPKLSIDYRVNLIMPYHVLLDEGFEKGSKGIGTTKLGIGPCYADRSNRTGIRFFDILDEKRLSEKLKFLLPLKTAELK